MKLKQVKIVENVIEAKNVIEQFSSQGYTKNEVHLLIHEKDELPNEMDTKKVGVVDEDEFNSLANVFCSRGEEMRSKMKSLGLSDLEADQYEENLDQGYLAVIAAKVV